MKVLFDTGSPLMYVMTDLCGENCDNQLDKFVSKDSKSFKPSEQRTDQGYGSGSISGAISTETICFAKNDDNSCIENASFIAVDKSRDTGRDRFSGLVGLSPF